MNNLNKRADELSERYPHYRTYAACQSQAFMLGSLTFVGAAAITYVGMDQWFQRFKPSISRNWLVAGPILGGIGVAYVLTMRRTAICTNMWMAMEERHSVLTPASERLTERIEAKKSNDSS